MTRTPSGLIRAGMLSAILVAAVTLAVGPDADAQPKAKPAPVLPKTRLVVEPVNPAPGWAVRVNVLKVENGTDVAVPDRTFKVGDELVVHVTTEQGGFLYLFNIDAAGETSLLFPNQIERDNKIPATPAASPDAAPTPIRVPGPGAGFKLRVTPNNTGTEYMKAVVAQEPLTDLTNLVRAAPRKAGPIAVPTGTLAAALREAAFRGVKAAPNTGNLSRDLQKMRSTPGTSGVAVEEVQKFEKVCKSWAEHQVEIYTGNKGGGTQPIVQQTRRVAILVGISKFSSPSIRPLGCAHKDAIDVADVLRSSGKFDDIVLLTDEKATLANIRAEFSRAASETRPGDTVLLFWAGHGGRSASTDPTDPDGLAEYLVPHDGSLASATEIQSTMLTDKAFGRWVQELDGRKVMVVLDTCHSGGQIEGMRAPKALPTNRDGSPKFSRGINTPNLNPKARWNESHMLKSELNRFRGLKTRDIRRSDAAVLAAASPRQFAFETTDGKNGVMTSFVLEYLRSQSGPVTLADLHRYVGPKVEKYATDNFPGSPQTPVFSDETPWTPVILRP